MDVMRDLDLIFESYRNARSKYHETPGSLLNALKDTPEGRYVVFEDRTSPCNPHSYRGYYSDCAFESASEPITVDEFKTILETKVIGKTMLGYKGGENLMTEDTPLWKAEYSHTGEAITHWEFDSYGDVVLYTKEVR